jgi:hypothetical protein
VKLAIWSPRADDGLARLVPALRTRMDVVWVSEDASPAGVPHARPHEEARADLALYDVADVPAHAFAFRRAREHPGVVLLRDWALVRLLALEMSRRETRTAALAEMQRGHGDEGAFVARLVGRGIGGELLPALFPLNERLLETSLGLVSLTEETRRRAARRLGDDRVTRVPLHLLPHLLSHLLASEPVSQAEARRSLAIPADALVVASGQPDSFHRSALLRVAARLRTEFSNLSVLIGDSSETEGATAVPDLGTMAAAADVVVALDPLAPGAIPAGLAEAIAARRPLMLSEGSQAVTDFREGTAAFVTPGRLEEAELEAVLRHLLRHADLRERLGRLAADTASSAADPAGLAEKLVSFLLDIHARQDSILAQCREARVREETLLGLLAAEVEDGARSLGLRGLDLGVRPLFEPLLRGPR